MTTYQLAERLARRLRGGKLTELDMPAAMDVVEAINSGLQECYELLPSWQRRTTVDFALPAPTTINVDVVNGSVNLGAGGSSFAAGQIGSSVVVAGDANWNEVQSENKLLSPYVGTNGVKSATIYGDSAFNNLSNFEGFSSHPRLAVSRKELTFFDVRKSEQAGEVGEPRHYWVEPASAALGTTPNAYLRFFPAPAVLTVIRMEMEFRPFLISYATMNAAAVIPLADQFLNRGLIPLCDEALMRSPEFVDMAKVNLIVAAADSARNFLRNQRQSVSLPANKISTRQGY